MTDEAIELRQCAAVVLRHLCLRRDQIATAIRVIEELQSIRQTNETISGLEAIGPDVYAGWSPGRG
jgi:hypothetical protein